jgi:hypothetical protein
MIAAAAILIVLTLVITFAVAAGLRGWVFAEARTEARLHAPSTHTLSYALPTGVDPAVVRGALTKAGFISAVDTAGTHQCLLVECAAQDRDRLRSVIASAPETVYGGSELTLHHVLFEDER